MQTSPRVLACYGDFAADVIADGILTDPWVDGAPRFRMTPIALDRATQRQLYAAAEAVAALHAAAADLCAATPALVQRFFQLPPSFGVMWGASAGRSDRNPGRVPWTSRDDSAGQSPAPSTRWHGIARADVFLTAAGPQVCELNSDTPSGEPEAVALNRLVDGAGAAGFQDPNCGLGDAVLDLIQASAPRDRPLTIGIVYPTEMTEDLSVIAQYARWCAARGARVVLGSPFNLRPDGQGGVSLFGVSCSVIWRHYKTDWWGERRPIWRSEPPYADPAPLSEQLELLVGAIRRGRCAVINPFGAVLTQNKRMMALLWEERDRFSPACRQAIRRYVPYTARLETLPRAQLLAERERWVLKSDYGCEGEEVVIGAETPPAVWTDVLADALPDRWIAQRRFDPLTDRHGRSINHGVYLVGGRAAGLFTRVQTGGTDRHATCGPTLVRLS